MQRAKLCSRPASAVSSSNDSGTGHSLSERPEILAHPEQLLSREADSPIHKGFYHYELMQLITSASDVNCQLKHLVLRMTGQLF